MNATHEQMERSAVAELPKLAAPDAERAISIVNDWLYREVKMLVHASEATFIPASYCWHLPVRISYPNCGSLSVIGDIYLHAATGQFIGLPAAVDLQCRAENRLKVCGLNEGAEED